MELKDLEALWTEMDRELEKQKKLTNTIIMEMTQQKYANKFQKLSFYETIGGIICILAGIYLLTEFSVLDTWYLKLCGGFTVLILFLLPIVTLRSLRRIQSINIADKNMKETLISYGQARDQLLFLQRLGIYLSIVLMFTILPVVNRIWNGNDMFTEPRIWYIYIPVLSVFLFFFARWGYGCYRRITDSAESLLKELE